MPLRPLRPNRIYPATSGLDLEADQLAVIVDICERRRSAVGSYDQLVTLQDDIEQRFLRGGGNREKHQNET